MWGRNDSSRYFVGCSCNAQDPGYISELGRYAEEGNGYPLQYSCLEKIPRTEEPGRLPSIGLQRVRHNWATSTFFFSPNVHQSTRVTVLERPLVTNQPSWPLPATLSPYPTCYHLTWGTAWYVQSWVINGLAQWNTWGTNTLPYWESTCNLESALWLHSLVSADSSNLASCMTVISTNEKLTCQWTNAV